MQNCLPKPAQVSTGAGLCLAFPTSVPEPPAVGIPDSLTNRVFEQAVLGIGVTDLEGRFVQASPALCRITGFSATELTGKAIQDIMHAEDLPELMEKCGSLMREEAPAFRLESRLVRPNGGFVWVRTSLSLFRREGGTPAGMVAMCEEIGEEIASRAALQEQLRQAQKMDTVGRLAAGVAHDLNNVLMVMMGYASMLTERLGDESVDGGRSKLIEVAGERGAALTRQLLSFSRKQAPLRKVIALDVVIAGSESILRRFLGEDVRLATDLRSNARVRIDPGQLEQIIVNLAANSRDAMPDGGRMLISTREDEIEDVCFGVEHHELAAGQYAVLTVRDDGHGMNAATRARLFEPFFTTKQPGKGTGLGLTTVYGIVKQNGGSIEVESEPGRGTIFRIYLPAVQEQVERGSVTSLSPLPCGEEIVLLAEDGDMVRQMVEQSLRKLGYQVLPARNGVEALEIADRFQNRLDAVVADAVMPKMGGHELVRKLRSADPELRALFMSGHADRVPSAAGALDEKTCFLQKPFAPHILAAKLRHMLDFRVSL